MSFGFWWKLWPLNRGFTYVHLSIGDTAIEQSNCMLMHLFMRINLSKYLVKVSTQL